MASTFLSSPLVQEVVLPFLLIFAVVFAVLQKSEILGKGKRQVDAIVALVTGLIFVSFGKAVGIVAGLMPFLAVGLVVILVFMILYGMVFKEGEFKMPGAVQWVFFGLIAVAVIVAVLIAAGQWSYFKDLVTGGGTGSDILTNVVLILLVIGAIVAVLVGAGKGKEKEEKK